MIGSIRVLLPCSAILAACFLLWAGLFAHDGIAYVNGPPPATTGGFGEDTCHKCHFDYDLNDKTGALVLEGVPEDYTPGESYVVTIRLAHPRLERAGFQLAVRFAGGEDSGRQAGLLEALDERVQVMDGDETSVQYARQTAAGSVPDYQGAAEWSVRWRPPDAPAPAVVFHVAAVAANFDESPLGDFPYSHEVTARLSRLLAISIR